MWEMQQLGRRAGALDVGLISNRSEYDPSTIRGDDFVSSSAQGLDERDVATFESRTE